MNNLYVYCGHPDQTVIIKLIIISRFANFLCGFPVDAFYWNKYWAFRIKSSPLADNVYAAALFFGHLKVFLIRRFLFFVAQSIVLDNKPVF